METHYDWIEADLDVLKQECREERSPLFCCYCMGVLIDRLGRRRTRDPIWQYGHVVNGQFIKLGEVHQFCSYGMEISSADASDPNWGKPPPEWT